MSVPGQSDPCSLIKVTVCYPQPDQNWQVDIFLQSGSCVQDAINASGFLQEFLTIDLAKNGVGVYGKLAQMDQLLAADDRVEIYRPLTFDPKTSRRRRAIHREKTRNIKKKVPIDDLTKV